ncbi:DUF4410 domain-containing protein [Methylococcus sp. EFPC2]|uniref:DUF4410 domain-containing protein n=1 Tax=Methylococcus sp. EFPC2 TaxID=2812648 RepID=UPI001967754A|nr:DUF4410 domain-containing protein [Methylococcus sp. EFPC2]QSA97853.1 DUF4410 domain-containing protein [Methylococcus sp. EFPC2]
MHAIRLIKLMIYLMLAMVITGCAGTAVQTRSEIASAGLARPKQINVYDFAVNPSEIQQNSGPLARLMRSSSASEQTAEQMAIGREVADALATELTEGLKELGFNAVRSTRNMTVAEGTILVTGAFVNIDEGNKARRTLVGLGLGQSSLDTQVSVLAPGGREYRELIGFDVHTDSGSMPGAAVMGPAGAAAGAGTAAVVASNAALGTIKNYRSAAAQQAKQQAEKIVSALSKYFLQQGWIRPEQVR